MKVNRGREVVIPGKLESVELNGFYNTKNPFVKFVPGLDGRVQVYVRSFATEKWTTYTTTSLSELNAAVIELNAR